MNLGRGTLLVRSVGIVVRLVVVSVEKICRGQNGFELGLWRLGLLLLQSGAEGRRNR